MQPKLRQRFHQVEHQIGRILSQSPQQVCQVIAIDSHHVDKVIVRDQRARHIVGLIDNIQARFMAQHFVAVIGKIDVVQHQDALLMKRAGRFAGPSGRFARVVGHGRTY